MTGEKTIEEPGECTCNKLEGRNSGGFVGSGSCQACWAKKRAGRDKQILKDLGLTKKEVIAIRNEKGL